MKAFIKEIPGHARAYTIWLALILALGTLIATGKWSSAIESIFLVFGIFLADQATHLAQEEHQRTPTVIERFMQHHHLVSVMLGTIIATISLILISLG